MSSYKVKHTLRWTKQLKSYIFTKDVWKPMSSPGLVYRYSTEACFWQHEQKITQMSTNRWMDGLVTVCPQNAKLPALKRTSPDHRAAWMNLKTLCDLSEVSSSQWLHAAQVVCMRQALGPGALGRPRGIGWRGRWEGGLGWGTHVNPWLFHFNVWQNPLQ